MKYFFRALIFLAISIFLIACGQSVTVTPLPLPSPSQPLIPTSQPEVTPTNDINILPTLSFGAPDDTKVPFPTPNPKIPTLMPTIDPQLVPDLLRKSISVQTLTGVNGHNVQRITGWNYGFSCAGHQWLDSKHLLLYPRTGQTIKYYMGGSIQEGLSSEPIIVNISNGTLWLLPQSNMTSSESPCNLAYWSPALGIIIYQESNESNSRPMVDNIFTYTFDGMKINQYNGKISGVSPSGEKILVNDKTIIDLRNNKITDLNWHIGNDPAIPPNFFTQSDPTLPINFYWSPDETRLYRCCFYFADLKANTSYNFLWSDLHGVDGKPLPTPVLPHTHGEWVQNGNFFLVEWNYFSDFSADYIPMFSPTEMKYYDLVTMAGIPKTSAYISAATYSVSPNGEYAWIEGFGYDGKYYDFLIDLTSFVTTTYDKATDDFEWSPDSKFAQLIIFDFPQTTSKIYILSEAQNTLTVFPTEPTTTPVWRPSDHISAYLTNQNKTLDILDPQDMSVKELNLPSTFYDLVWSPDGNHLALVATDGSLWQVDYPQMKKIEQLTQLMPAGTIQWSPDSKSIAFTSGTDIYIVDATK